MDDPHAGTLGKACEQCNQRFGDLEADKLPERQEKIVWARKGRNAQGVRTIEVGEGELCLPCDDTRKYNFGSVPSKTLKAVR